MVWHKKLLYTCPIQQQKILYYFSFTVVFIYISFLIKIPQTLHYLYIYMNLRIHRMHIGLVIQAPCIDLSLFSRKQ